MQVAACSRVDASHGLFVTDVTAGPGQAAPAATRCAVFGVDDGLYSSRSHVIRAVRLSHECMGQGITSIRAHGPEECRYIPRLCSLSRGPPGEAARVAIAVLMPFHSITTPDSGERSSGGLAKNPSEVLNPPSPLLIHVVLRQ